MDPRERLRKAYELLKPLPLDLGEFVVSYASTPFEALVAVLLSQNTSDKRAIEALRRLKQVLGGSVTPEALLEADPEELVEAVKPAGMQKQRVAKLRALAEAVARSPSLLDEIRDMDVEEARRKLLELPGVGPKTADVMLSLMGKPSFPVDTHISRVAPRLLGRESMSYEEIRRTAIEALGDPKALRELHLKLIIVGRRWCRPRSPRCAECPLSPACASAKGEASSRMGSRVGTAGHHRP